MAIPIAPTPVLNNKEWVQLEKELDSGKPHGRISDQKRIDNYVRTVIAKKVCVSGKK